MSKALEEGVIGALLAREQFRPVIFSLAESHYFPHYSYIFTEAKNQYEQGIAFTNDTLEAKIGSQGGILYDIQFNQYASEDRIEDAIRILAEQADKKQLLESLNLTVANASSKSFDELLSEIGILSQSADSKSVASLTPSEILAREEKAPKKERLVIGSNLMDEHLFKGAGTCKGDVLSILAESGHGKTQGALYFASQWARKGYTGAWFQLEDYDVNTANALVDMSMQDADNIFINDAMDEIHAIKRECMRLKHQYGLDFVVIDYLQIVKIKDGKRRDSKTLEIEDILEVVKDIAKKLNVVVVITSQATVDKIKTGWSRIPNIDDAKWARAIKEASHGVISVFRPNMVEGVRKTEFDGEKFVLDAKGDKTYPFNSVFIKKRKDRRHPLYMELIHMIHTEKMGLQVYKKF